MPALKKKFDNDKWVKDHFEMIVEKYGGKVPYVLVARGKVFPVTSSEELPKLENRLRRKYGPPIGMPVPHPQDFLSVLVQIRLRA